MLETQNPLHDAPTVVFAPAASRRLIVHLFASTVAHIRDIERAGLLIKGKSPRIAQPQRPDLVTIDFNLRERVVGGNAVVVQQSFIVG